MLAQNLTGQLLGADRMSAVAGVADCQHDRLPLHPTGPAHHLPERPWGRNGERMPLVRHVLPVANCFTASGMELHRGERASLTPCRAPM